MNLPCSPSVQNSWKCTPWHPWPCRDLLWSQFSQFQQGLMALRSWSGGETESRWCSTCTWQQTNKTTSEQFSIHISCKLDDLMQIENWWAAVTDQWGGWWPGVAYFRHTRMSKETEHRRCWQSSGEAARSSCAAAVKATGMTVRWKPAGKTDIKQQFQMKNIKTILLWLNIK